MHKYVLKLTKYNESGALTSEVSFVYCDTPQQVADKKTQYEKMRYTSTDEEGQVVTGLKMYKVTAMQCVYEEIEEFDVFCDVNKVLR